MMDLDTPETRRGWRNILRICCAPSWFFFTRLVVFIIRFRLVAKCACYVCYVRPSVCLPTCVSTVPTGRFFVKFDTEEFYKNLPRNSKFFLKRAKIEWWRKFAATVSCLTVEKKGAVRRVHNAPTSQREDPYMGTPRAVDEYITDLV